MGVPRGKRPASFFSWSFFFFGRSVPSWYEERTPPLGPLVTIVTLLFRTPLMISLPPNYQWNSRPRGTGSPFLQRLMSCSSSPLRLFFFIFLPVSVFITFRLCSPLCTSLGFLRLFFFATPVEDLLLLDFQNRVLSLSFSSPFQFAVRLGFCD